MNSLLRCLLLALLFMVASNTAAMTINDLNPGKSASGKDLSTKELKGKVVLVVYWGMRCPACLAEIPQWVAMYAKYHGQGFEIIGLESQYSRESSIAALAQSRGMGFTLTSGGSLKGAAVSSIPHSFLFGADGNLVQDNPSYGAELERKIAALIKDSPSAVASRPPDVKEVQSPPVTSQPKPVIAENNAPNATIARKTSKESPEVAVTCGPLHSLAQDQHDNTVVEKAEETLAARTLLDTLAVEFRAEKIARKAAEEVASKTKRPASQKEPNGSSSKHEP